MKFEATLFHSLKICAGNNNKTKRSIDAITDVEIFKISYILKVPKAAFLAKLLVKASEAPLIEALATPLVALLNPFQSLIPTSSVPLVILGQLLPTFLRSLGGLDDSLSSFPSTFLRSLGGLGDSLSSFPSTFLRSLVDSLSYLPPPSPVPLLLFHKFDTKDHKYKDGSHNKILNLTFSTYKHLR